MPTFSGVHERGESLARTPSERPDERAAITAVWPARRPVSGSCASSTAMATTSSSPPWRPKILAAWPSTRWHTWWLSSSRCPPTRQWCGVTYFLAAHGYISWLRLHQAAWLSLLPGGTMWGLIRSVTARSGQRRSGSGRSWRAPASQRLDTIFTPR
jgi:hypothetical protein